MYKLHIPTEQYGFVEVEVEHLEDLESTYVSVKRQFDNRDGLDAKNWRRALDLYLSTNKLIADDYDQMSRSQKTLIQEIKRSLNRINK